MTSEIMGAFGEGCGGHEQRIHAAGATDWYPIRVSGRPDGR
jgi:hypothetical protein